MAAAIVLKNRRDSLSSSSENTVFHDDKSNTLPYQKEVRSFYLQNSIQILVAVVILLNFATAALQAEILPEDNTPTSRTFLAFEYFYVYAFLIELLVNMYGHYWWDFWKSGWNWFDFIIVLVSLMAMYFPDLPAISVLRLFRAFRVVRIFKRVKEMKKIIEGIMRSLPALSYAFVAMGLIMGIWGIMGVDFFSDMAVEDTNGDLIDGYFFGTFFRATLSLAQIMTFDSWSSGIARDTIYAKGAIAAVYFMTYVFVAGIIMMNVLVALLLDNYLAPSESEGEKEKDDVDKPVKYTPEIVFKDVVRYLGTTRIETHQIGQYLRSITFPTFYVMCKSKQIDDICARCSDGEEFGIEDRNEYQPIADSLLKIENQLTALQKPEHREYNPAIIGNFSFKEKVLKVEVYSLPYQKEVKDFYSRHSVQIFVAIIIFMNFITSAIYVQLLPEENSSTDNIFLGFEYFYVYGFFLELLVNMYGNFFFPFWQSGWNIFDFIIVIVSFLAMYFPDIPGISVLRLFRAFRVARLFKRVDEMKKIIEGIMKSLPSLSYAFVALGLVTGIWAIMGVDFYSGMDNGGEEGYYFGNFFKAFLSLLQITTFDSWSSGIARDVIYEKGAAAALYFATYVFFSSIIMMNVLVALLLDNYLSPSIEKDDTVLSPEEAMMQITDHAKKLKFDLTQFHEFLRDWGFPEFIAHYQNVENCVSVAGGEDEQRYQELCDDGEKYITNTCGGVYKRNWKGEPSASTVEVEMPIRNVVVGKPPAYKNTPSVGVSVSLADVVNITDSPSTCSSISQIDNVLSNPEKSDERPLRATNPSYSTQNPKKAHQYVFF